MKRVAWSRAIPFTQVHRLARVHRASMNDVVMAALAGARLASLMLWAPTSGRLGLSVTILGYAGEIRISVAADCSLPLEPEALIEDVERELEDGAAAARALSRERAGMRDSGSRRSMDIPWSPGSA